MSIYLRIKYAHVFGGGKDKANYGTNAVLAQVVAEAACAVFDVIHHIRSAVLRMTDADVKYRADEISKRLEYEEQET
jgi:hypothetical protein